MNKQRVLLVVGDPAFNPLSENSAVSNFLNSIVGALRDFDVVFINPSTNVAKISKPGIIKKKNGFKNWFRSTFPYIYNSIRLFYFFREQYKLQRSALKQCHEGDILIEFLVFGSGIGVQCKRRKKCKLLVIYDSPLGEQFKEMYKSSSAYNYRINKNERLSVSHADKLICYSNAVADCLVKKGANRGKIQIIPCIVWKGGSQKNINTNRFNIAFIGSFLSWHKVDLLVDAFEKLASVYPNFVLSLIGFGEEWEMINKRVNKSEFSNRIFMPGYVSEEELKKLKVEIDVGVMSGSNWYGSPLKLFEYAESGIPIIAPSTPTVTEYFIHNENALIIDSENPLNSLVAHLKELIENKEKREKLGAAGLKMMQTDFAKDRVMSKFVNLVNEVLNNE